MVDIKIEQRINLKFPVKLKKSPTECLQMLKEVFGDNIFMSVREFFNVTNDFLKVGQRSKMMNVPVDL